MNYKHGMRKTRVYRIWCCMKNRCNNPHKWQRDELIAIKHTYREKLKELKGRAC